MPIHRTAARPFAAHRFAAGLAALALAAAGGPVASAQELDAATFTQPEDVTLYDAAPREELVAMGEDLFEDPSLSPNETTCMTCHAGLTGYNDTFAQAYPHPVAMAANRAGMAEVDAAEMVQLCMAVPMAAEPLDWESRELAALAAYVEELQQQYAAQQ
jgi:cytochrome c peroxidase